MDPLSALAFAQQLLSLVPLLVNGFTSAASGFEAGKTAIDKMIAENRDPTDEEWAALNSITTQLMTELNTD